MHINNITANSHHICNIYVLRNNLVRIDDNICTIDESYTYSLHPVTYLIPKCGTYCCYHSVTIFTICTRP